MLVTCLSVIKRSIWWIVIVSQNVSCLSLNSALLWTLVNLHRTDIGPLKRWIGMGTQSNYQVISYPRSVSLHGNKICCHINPYKVIIIRHMKNWIRCSRCSPFCTCLIDLSKRHILNPARSYRMLILLCTDSIPYYVAFW